MKTANVIHAVYATSSSNRDFWLLLGNKKQAPAAPFLGFMYLWHWWREGKILPPAHQPLFPETGRKRVEGQSGGQKKRNLKRSSRTASFCNLLLVIYCLLLNREDVKVALWKKKKNWEEQTDGMLMRILCNGIKMPGRRFPYGALTGGSQGRMVRVL